MISEDESYRVGTRAMIYMILHKLRYPVILGVIMLVITFLLSLAQPTLALWQTGASHFLKETAYILAQVQVCGWLFTISLAVLFGLSAVPEYRGLTVRLGSDAFYVRRGILVHREIAIPYHQIQTINIIEPLYPIGGTLKGKPHIRKHKENNHVDKPYKPIQEKGDNERGS